MIKNSTKTEKKEYKTPKVRFAEVQPKKVLCSSPNEIEDAEEEDYGEY